MNDVLCYAFIDLMPDAIQREKRLKDWQRACKVRLMLGANLPWRNLFDPSTDEIAALPSHAAGFPAIYGCGSASFIKVS